MNRQGYAVIILAAGLSSRMSGFKPLMPLGDATILDHVISTFQQNHVDIYLVLGHRRDEIRRRIKHKAINIIDNPAYEQGMFTSVQAGVRRLPSDCRQIFIMPADIPLARPATIARLISESEKHPGKIIYPLFAGRRGHPPLIPASRIPTILNFTGDGGLKAALTSESGDALDILVPDSNILFDIDTEEDYQELLERRQRLDVPTDAERRVIMNDICKAPPQVIRHCQKVSEVALLIGQWLKQAGQPVDLELIQAAAELHDLAREYPDHESEGARILRGMGFDKIADIVAVHMELPERADDVALNGKIVFLADKLVHGEDLISIEERYGSASLAYGKTPDVIAKIEERKNQALRVKREIEELLRYPLENRLDDL